MKRKGIRTSSFVGAFMLAGVLGSMLLGAQHTAAQTPGDLTVSTDGMTAVATFTRSTPCAPYTLEWGDGEEDGFAEESDFCIEVIDTQVVSHEYVNEGEYTVTLTLGERTVTTTVEVPGEVPAFMLEDVASITSEWVDPSVEMADEEYHLYTITLKRGEVIKVQVAGFTTAEMRNQRFVEAGFTGDVAELLAMIEEEEVVDDHERPTEPLQEAALYQELIDVLQRLIQAMTLLLEQQ